MLTWLKKTWQKFETWLYKWWPGAKTKIITGLGSLGMTAAALQEYVTGLPLTKYITAETLSIITAVLFTLSYWFRGMGARVQAANA